MQSLCNCCGHKTDTHCHAQDAQKLAEELSAPVASAADCFRSLKQVSSEVLATAVPGAVQGGISPEPAAELQQLHSQAQFADQALAEAQAPAEQAPAEQDNPVIVTAAADHNRSKDQIHLGSAESEGQQEHAFMVSDAEKSAAHLNCIDSAAKPSFAQTGNAAQQTISTSVEAGTVAVPALDSTIAGDQASAAAAIVESQAALPLPVCNGSKTPLQEQQLDKQQAWTAPIPASPVADEDGAARSDLTAADKPALASPLTRANKRQTASSTPDSPASAASEHTLGLGEGKCPTADTQVDKENSPSVASSTHSDSQNSLQNLKEQQHSRAATAAAAAVVADGFTQQPPSVRPRPRLRRQPKIDKGPSPTAPPVCAAAPALHNAACEVKQLPEP